MPENRMCSTNKLPSKFREAVCVDTNRVYDSCADKDCLADLRVYFGNGAQQVIDNAINVRLKSAEVLNVIIDVEKTPFNRGCYTCDLTFFFKVRLDVYTTASANPVPVCGFTTFSKKCVLYGSEGKVKVFSSEYTAGEQDDQLVSTNTNPRVKVQVAEPVALDARLCNVCDCCNTVNDLSFVLPRSIRRAFDDEFPDNVFTRQTERAVAVTIGIFSIVQIERDVQLLMPVYDFCVPSKECSCNTDDPCDAFRKICFPTDEFFPPNAQNLNGDNDCGCSQN